MVADLEPLPAVVEPLAARQDPAALVHDEWGDNVYVALPIAGGDIDSVRDAPVRVTRDYRMNRQSTMPMEGRAVLAHWDERADELVVYLTSQIPHIMRVGLAEMLGLQHASGPGDLARCRRRVRRQGADDAGGHRGLRHRA